MRNVQGAWLFGLGLISALAGCGSSGDTPGGLDAFLGLWNAQSASMAVTCSGKTTTNPINGNLTWIPGTSSDAIGELAGTPGCQVQASISGNKATGSMAEPCTITLGQEADTYTYQTYTFTLGSGGKGTENASGTVSQLVYGGTGGVVQCTFSESGATYQKQ